MYYSLMTSFANTISVFGYYLLSMLFTSSAYRYLNAGKGHSSCSLIQNVKNTADLVLRSYFSFFVCHVNINLDHLFLIQQIVNAREIEGEGGEGGRGREQLRSPSHLFSRLRVRT